MGSIVAIFFYCVVICLEAKGQDSLFKKNAIFLTFEEFRNNSPSIDGLKVFLKEHNTYDRTVQLNGNMPDSQAITKGKFWGFSDSNELYINYKGRLAMFIEMGNYCVFSYMKNVILWGYGGGPNGVGYSYPTFNGIEETHFYWILNYYTGEIEQMKVNKIKKYLADDEELLKEYKNENDQEGFMLEYLRQYNKKHPISQAGK